MDCLNHCFILLFLVAWLSLIHFSPQRWHIALSMSESLPAQRDGKFTVGLTQILLGGYLAILAVIWTPWNGQSRMCLKLSTHMFVLIVSFLHRREYRHTVFVLYMLITGRLTLHTQ